MSKAEEMGFVRQAESELRQRISQTTNICDQFKRSYSGYSSAFWQIVLLILLVLAVVGLIWMATNIAVILNVFSTQDYSRDSSLARTALVGILLYIMLNMGKYIIRIVKISTIDSLVHHVRNIEKKLQSSLENLGKKANDLDKIVFGQTNSEIKADYHVDAEIAKYSGIVKAYSNPDNDVLSVTLTIMHWISGILFISVFLFITTPFVIGKIGGEQKEIVETQVSTIVYGTVTASVLNIREGPGSNYTEQGKLHNGDKVVISDRYEDQTWVRIEYGENKSGYVNKDYLLIREEKFYDSVSRITAPASLNISFTLAYIAVVIILFMIFQEFFAKNSILDIHEKFKKVTGVLLTIAGICGAITIFGMELYYFLSASIFNTLSFIYCFIPLITLSIFLSIILKICELTGFNTAYALLGMIFAGITGVFFGIIAGIICEITGGSDSKVLSILHIIIAICAVFGLFWNAFETSRENFSLHRTFLGVLCGILYGIGFSLRVPFSGFRAAGCLWGLVLFAISVAISPIFIIIYIFKGYIMYGRGDDWSDFEDLFSW
jgi:hypothetical protein